MGMVPNGKMHATDVHYFSDAAEIKRTAFLVREAAGIVSTSPKKFLNELRWLFLTWLDFRLAETGHAIFAGCFTANGNLLSQWRSYGEPSKGVSLGFAPDKLAKSARDQSWLLAKCIYDENSQKQLAKEILAAVDELGTHEFSASRPPTGGAARTLFESIEDDLLRIAVLLKYPAFDEEQEWRLVSPVYTNSAAPPVEFREGHSTLTPYVPFDLPANKKGVDLEHVWIGPTPHPNNAVIAVNNYLARHGSSSPRLGAGYCNIPYRTW
jgi:hypothetical protein